MKRRIRTLAGLQRVYNAMNNRLSRLYAQPYILQPALKRNLARFDELNRIEDPAARFEAFRLIPAVEYDLEAVYSGLGPEKRKSLAQQGRARHRRVRLTNNGDTLEGIVRDLLHESGDPGKLKAKEYWPRLIGKLGELGLNPDVVADPTDPSREKVEYDHDGKRRTLSPGQFANIVSRLRQQLPALN